MEILSVSQASTYCNVPMETVIEWLETGRLRALITEGGHRGIKQDDLDALLTEMGLPLPAKINLKERKKILVVDDDKIIVDTVVQALEDDENGYELMSAADGVQAELQIARFKPDLIILDIMIPDINGYEVCRKVKSDPATNGIKIIVLSAYLSEEAFVQMRTYGADLCFSKPLPIAQLKKEVAKLLGLEHV
jgi:excisionase family DNA binding protein